MEYGSRLDCFVHWLLCHVGIHSHPRAAEGWEPPNYCRYCGIRCE